MKSEPCAERRQQTTSREWHRSACQSALIDHTYLPQARLPSLLVCLLFTHSDGRALHSAPISIMMRTKPSTAMQKTYDECYLICSTAVYFESQVSLTPASRCGS